MGQRLGMVWDITLISGALLFLSCIIIRTTIKLLAIPIGILRMVNRTPGPLVLFTAINIRRPTIGGNGATFPIARWANSGPFANILEIDQLNVDPP